MGMNPLIEYLEDIASIELWCDKDDFSVYDGTPEFTPYNMCVPKQFNPWHDAKGPFREVTVEKI